MGTGESPTPTKSTKTAVGQLCTSGGTGDRKTAEFREKLSVKSERMSGGLGILSGKATEDGKESSHDGVFSQSADSESEVSSDGSDALSYHEVPHMLQTGSGEYISADATGEQCTRLPVGTKSSDMQPLNVQIGGAYATGEDHALGTVSSESAPATQTVVAEKPVNAALPTTNLNIGLDYWNGSTPATSPSGKRRTNITCGLTVSSALMGTSGDGVPPELWLQDERELKKQRRKQANRESARRSRLRKQAEYEELAGRVESLTNENTSLRMEVNRLKELCRKFSSENDSLQEQVLKAQGKSKDLNIQP